MMKRSTGKEQDQKNTQYMHNSTMSPHLILYLIFLMHKDF